jgi:hypothetical protein
VTAPFCRAVASMRPGDPEEAERVHQLQKHGLRPGVPGQGGADRGLG